MEPQLNYSILDPKMASIIAGRRDLVRHMCVCLYCIFFIISVTLTIPLFFIWKSSCQVLLSSYHEAAFRLKVKAPELEGSFRAEVVMETEDEVGLFLWHRNIS